MGCDAALRVVTECRAPGDMLHALKTLQGLVPVQLVRLGFRHLGRLGLFISTERLGGAVTSFPRLLVIPKLLLLSVFLERPLRGFSSDLEERRLFPRCLAHGVPTVALPVPQEA